MTQTRTAPYFWLALSGSVHLGLILFSLWWSTSAAYKVISKIEVSYVNPASTAAPQPKLEKKVSAQPVVSAKPVAEIAPEPAASVAETSTDSVAQSTQDAVAGNSQAVLEEYERYALEVAQTLNRNKIYPDISRRLRQQGRVKVRFRVERSGRVMAAEVVEQSSFNHLNSAAQRLIEDIRFFRPFPADVKETTWLFTVPIEYRM